MNPPADPVISGHQLRSAFDNAPIGMAVLTIPGTVIVTNSALDQLLGCSPRAMTGRALFDVTHPDDLSAARDMCARMQSGATRIVRHECRFLRPDGTEVWVLVSTSHVAGTADRPAHLIMHIEDISDRKELEAELRHRATHDPLTGLPNRTLFADRIGHAQRAGTSPRRHCLFYLDLNGFKQVNDLFGHAAGDAVLQQLARRLTALLRPGDIAARLGGDEFAVLCVDTEPRHADRIAERLRAAAAEPFQVGGHTITLTAAVGISTSTTTESGAAPSGPDDLLGRADLRMYETKRQRTAGPTP